MLVELCLCITLKERKKHITPYCYLTNIGRSVQKTRSTQLNPYGLGRIINLFGLGWIQKNKNFMDLVYSWVHLK